MKSPGRFCRPKPFFWQTWKNQTKIKQAKVVKTKPNQTKKSKDFKITYVIQSAVWGYQPYHPNENLSMVTKVFKVIGRMRLSAASAEWKLFNGYQPYESLSAVWGHQGLNERFAIHCSEHACSLFLKSNTATAGQRHKKATTATAGQRHKKATTATTIQQQEALCTAPATRQPAAGQRRRLCVRRLPHDSQPQASGGHARSLNPLAKPFTNPLT